MILIWYQYKEETHSYTLVANIRIYGVHYRKSRLDNPLRRTCCRTSSGRGLIFKSVKQHFFDSKMNLSEWKTTTSNVSQYEWVCSFFFFISVNFPYLWKGHDQTRMNVWKHFCFPFIIVFVHVRFVFYSCFVIIPKAFLFLFAEYVHVSIGAQQKSHF